MPNSDRPTEPLLTVEHLVALHVGAIERFGGSHGIRDGGLLESALARPLAGFGGHMLYQTPFARAAALAEGLIQNHPFVDGNKRMAMLAMGAWLFREGLNVEAERGELRDLALAIATHEMTVEQVAEWLEGRAVVIEGRGTADDGDHLGAP